jgi:phasin family protein
MHDTEELVAAQWANAQTMFAYTRAFDGVQQLIALNLQVVRASLEEAARSAAAAIKDGQELLALHTATLRPAFEMAASYFRQVHEIGASTNAEFTKVAEAHLANMQKTFVTKRAA